MNIYVAHSRSIDFENDLYLPIRQSVLNTEHTFVLPHENSAEPFESKIYLKNVADLMIAEVSDASIGLGIELGWANIYKVPIVCIYRKGSKISGSLKVVSNVFEEYTNSVDLIATIAKYVL